MPVCTSYKVSSREFEKVIKRLCIKLDPYASIIFCPERVSTPELGSAFKWHFKCSVDTADIIQRSAGNQRHPLTFPT
jgi:hypothetical protein